jgi:MoCo/4Fe-4S cofactor protein with predicted Tat translocation signal
MLGVPPMTAKQRQPLDLDALRRHLDGANGRQYWKSLEELASTPEFEEYLHREFPQQASEWNDPTGRREFLRLMAASLALAGLSACGAPGSGEEKIVPYVRQPEDLVPGKPLYYATAMPLGGYGQGLLVESHMGRPTKVEGNPEHPSSLGATDVWAQASVLTLYDPDRSQTVRQRGAIGTWSAFLGWLLPLLAEQRGRQGAGLRLLTGTVTSPTLAAQCEALLAAFPQARWHQYEPACSDSARIGSELVFGEMLATRYRFAEAEVVLSLDSDFLLFDPGRLRYARELIRGRFMREGQHKMSRIYALESTPSLVGTKADHRVALRAREVEGAARLVARGLGLEVTAPAEAPALPAGLLEALVADLKAHPGASVVIAGDGQPPEVHALAHLMNAALGNAGKTVLYTDPVEARPVRQVESLRELAEEMSSGAVQMLLVLGGNPAYDAPADLAFSSGLARVPHTIHMGLYFDETAERCDWHIPQAHYLESWSDVRAHDGTVSVVQPLIRPLFAGRSQHELLSALLGQPYAAPYDLVRAHWQAQGGFGEDFERRWRRSLHDGVIEGTALPERTAMARHSFAEIERGRQRPPQPPSAPGELEIVFRPDASLYDGSFANNGWLQELPRPLSKLTWDNAAFLAPRTAQQLGLQSEDVIELMHGGGRVRAAVWILPGQPHGSVAVHLGYGRERSGRVGEGPGFNAYLLRTSTAMGFGSALRIHKTGGRQRIACTQDHWSLEGRNIVRWGTLRQYEANPAFVQEQSVLGAHEAHPPSLYEDWKYEGNAWGMAVDMNACIGCNACAVACQAENNVPIVGKEQVLNGREMHWLRIDRYYSGSVDEPETHFQPMLCQHCEKAPCELVCPVAATSHSHEGINEMTYNRCVGTRYCANNCPYKVRRFNFLQYADFETPVLKLLRNPDVTVRSRGIMEKCTYCVQRVNAARIEAKKQDRPILDGEVVPACQQACPTEAIVFGNINDPEARVTRLKADPRNYGVLTELGTQPRTTYLAELRNPNPAIRTE